MSYKYKCKDCESVIEVETEQSPYSQCPICEGGELYLVPESGEAE